MLYEFDIKVLLPYVAFHVRHKDNYKHYLVFDRSSSTSKNPCRKGHQKCLSEASNHHLLLLNVTEW